MIYVIYDVTAQEIFNRSQKTLKKRALPRKSADFLEFQLLFLREMLRLRFAFGIDLLPGFPDLLATVNPPE